MPHLHGVGWMKNLPESTTQLISKLQQENAFALTSSQLASVVAIGRSALTVSTTADDILSQFPQLSPVQSDTVARMSLSLQQHSCSDRCQNHGIPGQVCKGFFPQLPSLFSDLLRCLGSKCRRHLCKPTKQDSSAAIEETSTRRGTA